MYDMTSLSKKDIEMKLRTNLYKGHRMAQVTPLSSRFKANTEILQVLKDLMIVFPDQRFGQILCNYVFPNYREEDPFFEESTTTLERLKKLK